LDLPTDAIRFFAFGFRWRRNFPAPRLLVADHTFDPETLLFVCFAGYPGIVLVFAEDDFVPDQLVPPAALGLPMRSYRLHVSSQPTLSACSAVAFATTAILFCTRC
jgi:hypothetical protein